MDAVTPRERHIETIKNIARWHDVPMRVLMSRSRLPKVVNARRTVCFYLHSEGLSSPQIGRMIERDHTSVLHLLGTRAASKKKGKKNAQS